MQLEPLALTSERVRERGARLLKIEALRELLEALPPNLSRPCVAMLAGILPSGKIGVGGAALREARPAEFAQTATLSMSDVLGTFSAIAASRGAGSKARKQELLNDLLGRSTEAEGNFLLRLLSGELRQGALEGVMIDALARHTGIDLERVRRAAMLAGDLPEVAEALLDRGEEALQDFRVTVFTPLQPMLAQPAESPEKALAGMKSAAIDLKLDGVRVQIHRRGDDVRIYSRRLNEVTRSVPELVEAARTWNADDFIVDGETFLAGKNGLPLPFQATMSRFSRRVNVAEARASNPLQVSLFDLLFCNGEDFTPQPLRARWATLEKLSAPRAEFSEVASPSEAKAFLDRALALGHEGAMVKDLDSHYRAGTRSVGWQKLKSSHTLDLVVLAAEWGSGPLVQARRWTHRPWPRTTLPADPDPTCPPASA